MGNIIKKIRLINFKRFAEYVIEPNEHINILVGDNEVGKSSILEAIDLVTSGNIRRIEKIGLDRLLNVDAVDRFNSGPRTFEGLPKLVVELYLLGNFDCTINGRNNIDGVTCDGVRLVCTPNPDYRSEIKEALDANADYFPYEYYSIRFSTFADEGYTGYKKKIRSFLIDSANMNTEYATNDFIRKTYLQYTEDDAKERAKHQCEYRLLKTNFQNDSLKALNERVPTDKNYAFGLRNGNLFNFENDLMIYENNVSIDNKGTGRQIIIKTDFALERAGSNTDVILIEEPENHLSPVNLRRLVERVSGSQDAQLFITTHSSFISTRLELQNLLIIKNDKNDMPIKLDDLKKDTAKYFLKAPPAGIVEYALSEKTLFVEGPSEYILLERFYQTTIGHIPEEDGVNIIDVRGLSFKRYLEIAKLAGNKVAVVTDNDGDFQKNCVKKYVDFADDENIKVFYDNDNEKRTFETVLYKDNISLCDELFKTKAHEYMLNNKTEAAFKLLSQEQPIVVPDYIKRAIKWIRE